jgi:hypothetical protein
MIFKLYAGSAMVLLIGVSTLAAEKAAPTPTPEPTPTPSASLVVKTKAVRPSLPKSDPKECRGVHLKHKDCHLQVGKTQVRFWQDKIFLNDSISRFTQTIKDQGDQIEWTMLKTRKISDEDIVEFSFWSPADPATGIETLHWFVYFVHGAHAELKLQKGIQKRVKTAGGVKRNDKVVPHELYVKGKKIFVKYAHEIIEL